MPVLSTASLLEALGAVDIPAKPDGRRLLLSEVPKPFKDRITPRLRSFEVRGLFGVYDHRVELSPSPGLTIIHGPNGVGKTRLMQMTDYVTDRWGFEWRGLTDAPFEQLTIRFDDRTHVGFLRKESRDRGAARLDEGAILISSGENRISLRELFESLPRKKRVTLYFREEDAFPAWLRPLRLDGRCTFIPSDRLFAYDDGASVRGVNLVESGVRNMARHAARTYALALHSLIEDLREELGRAAAGHWSDVVQRRDEHEERYRTVAENEGEAIAAGVLDDGLGVLGCEWDRSRDLAVALASSPRFSEVEEGMAEVMRGVAAASAFASIMQELMSDKVFRVDRTGVGCASADGEGPDEIPLADLSSGEQHLVVLFGKLLFDAVPGSLVMIDEPELSMHVAWQDCLVEKFIEAGKLADVDILLATHSPHIIGDHWDLAVELKGPGE